MHFFHSWLFVLFAISAGCMLLQFGLKIFIRRQARGAARQIMENCKLLAMNKYERARVSPSDFPWLNIEFYDSTARWMQQSAFDFLADIENVTASTQNPHMRTFSRIFLHQDGLTSGGCYHFLNRKAKNPKPNAAGENINDQCVCEFMTVFPGDIFIETTNAVGASTLNPVPNIIIKYLPAGFTPELIYKMHLMRVREYAEKNNVQPVPMHSLEDVNAQGDRQQMVKSQHRLKTGIISGDEVRKLGRGNPQFAEMVAQEVDKLRAASK